MSAGCERCPRCDSSGSIEGPDQGWYELECPRCEGTGCVAPAHAAPPVSDERRR